MISSHRYDGFVTRHKTTPNIRFNTDKTAPGFEVILNLFFAVLPVKRAVRQLEKSVQTTRYEIAF